MSTFATAFRRSQAMSVAAKEESLRCGHPEIDVEHLFLALIIIGGASARILTAEGITLQKARDAAAQVHADQIASLGITPLSPPPTSSIPDPMIAETRWSERALDVVRADDYRTDDRGVLTALLDEPSGHILRILDQVDVAETTLRDAIASYRDAAVDADVAAHNPAWQDVVYEGHVPAAHAAVWDLVSDPERRLEWDGVYAGRADWDGSVLTTLLPRTRPDGRKLTVKPKFNRAEHVISHFTPGEVIEWEQTWPDAADRNAIRRLRIQVRADGAGSRLTLTKSRPVSRALRRRLLNPFYRFFTWQELFTQAGGISRALR
jgi:hypothetical protein